MHPPNSIRSAQPAGRSGHFTPSRCHLGQATGSSSIASRARHSTITVPLIRIERPWSGRRSTSSRLGEFDAAQSRLIAATADLLGPFYGVPVKTLDRIGLDAIPGSAHRIHPTWGDHQVLTSHVLDLLRKRRPGDAVAVLGLTTADLWPGKGWNFVFGQASLQDRVGVWSLYRQGDPNAEYTTCLRRTLKTAAHETGHMLGILHCTAYECGMNGSNHRAEADARPLWFCPEDEMKVWWACRVDPAARYARLAEFAEEHGLVDEMRFWHRSLAALMGHRNTRRSH